MTPRISLPLCLVFGTLCAGTLQAQEEPKKSKKIPQKEPAALAEVATGVDLKKDAAIVANGYRREFYKTVGETRLPIYIVEPKGDKAEDRPAIVFYYGGGWNGRSMSQFVSHGTYLASRGMVVLLADYRSASAYGGTPSDCVADARSAMRWTRAHAERLGIDPQRIAAGGGSAGGHLAAACGMLDGFDDPKDDLQVAVKPNALVLFNPVYDNGPDGGWGHARVSKIWQSFSPAANISKDDPPTITFLGTKDRLIPVSTAERFEAAMKAAGLRSELHLYEGEGHGFFNPKKGANGKTIFVDTMDKADRFLTSLGFLEGEPTISAKHLETVIEDPQEN